MDESTVQKLLTLNHNFYEARAEAFAQSRQSPQEGFYRLLEYVPQTCPALLDIGCGDGRFARFLQAENRVIETYTGVDFSLKLLEIAQASVEGEFLQIDMSQPDCLAGLDQYDLIICLAALQHLPGYLNRIRLVRQMKEHLKPGGYVFLSTWQFMYSERYQRRVRDWQEIGLNVMEVDPSDYLLTWQREGFSYRYVRHIGEQETIDLVHSCGFEIATQFRSDGKEGDLNLYTVLTY